MTLMQLCKAALHISVFPCTMGGGGAGSPGTLRTNSNPIPFGHFHLHVPAQEMLLFFTSILALLQLLEGRRAVLCFSPACSTPFPSFGNDLLLPKSKLSFPVAQFSRSGLWSCFSWVPDRAAGTAHPICSSSPLREVRTGEAAHTQLN